MKGQLLMAFALVSVEMARSQTPRDFHRQGLQNYEQKQFEKALEQFEKAAAAAPAQRLDPAVPRYNAGNALLAMNRLEEASQSYQEALRSPDLALQAKAYYNRGNVLYQMAAAPGEGGLMTATAPAVLEEALHMYERAIFLDPHDVDAKVNYELALRLKEHIEQQRQQQQPASSPQQEQKENQPPPEQPAEEQPPEQPAAQPKPPAGQEQPGQTQPVPAEQMTEEEARMLLDRMKQEEQNYRDQLRVILGQPVPVEKDW